MKSAYLSFFREKPHPPKLTKNDSQSSTTREVLLRMKDIRNLEKVPQRQILCTVVVFVNSWKESSGKLSVQQKQSIIATLTSLFANESWRPCFSPKWIKTSSFPIFLRPPKIGRKSSIHYPSPKKSSFFSTIVSNEEKNAPNRKSEKPLEIYQ